jgi:uncharacterized protein YuzE
MKRISYDKENDLLFIHKGFYENEKFKTNIDIGDLILDLSTKKRIVGIEIINASEFLKEFGIGKSTMENMEDAKFEAQIKPNSIIIGLKLKTKKEEIPAKIAVPLHTKF